MTESLTDEHELTLAPIPSDWILEGNPVARNKCVAGSTDGMASTHVWDCTAGRFNWFYGCDETVYVLAGSVSLSDGVKRHLVRAGDTFFFPAGSRYEWTIDTYIRKVAFTHAPNSRRLRFVLRVFRALKRLARRGKSHREQPIGPGLAAVSTDRE
jgi:uncharacterized cupin superfamily protein